MSQTAQKRRAAEAAVQLVPPGICLGLGSGSTATLFVSLLGERAARGELPGLRCVPSSRAVQSQAEAAGLRLTGLEDEPALDLTVDGADQVDPDGLLVKGLGGALLREKILAAASRRYVIIVDQSKCVDRLGQGGPLPVEVLPFGWSQAARAVERLGGQPRLRRDAAGPVRTDQGNYLLDCEFGPIAAPDELAAALDAVPAILGHGLFLGMSTMVLVGHEDSVERRPGARPG